MPREADLIILDGGTFCYTNENGDVEAKKHEGFFYRDVRHLSHWRLLVDGEEIEPLTSRRVDYYSARVVGKPKGGDSPPTIAVGAGSNWIRVPRAMPWPSLRNRTWSDASSATSRPGGCRPRWIWKMSAKSDPNRKRSRIRTSSSLRFWTSTSS